MQSYQIQVPNSLRTFFLPNPSSSSSNNITRHSKIRASCKARPSLAIGCPTPTRTSNMWSNTTERKTTRTKMQHRAPARQEGTCPIQWIRQARARTTFQSRVASHQTWTVELLDRKKSVSSGAHIRMGRRWSRVWWTIWQKHRRRLMALEISLTISRSICCTLAHCLITLWLDRTLNKSTTIQRTKMRHLELRKSSIKKWLKCTITET